MNEPTTECIESQWWENTYKCSDSNKNPETDNAMLTKKRETRKDRMINENQQQH